jgi:hypothetical protein
VLERKGNGFQGARIIIDEKNLNVHNDNQLSRDAVAYFVWCSMSKRFNTRIVCDGV